MGTRLRAYAPSQLRQCKPPCRFLLKRCVLKLSFGNVTVAHSPKDLGTVRVLFNRSFVEALDRDIEVQSRNLTNSCEPCDTRGFKQNGPAPHSPTNVDEACPPWVFVPDARQHRQLRGGRGQDSAPVESAQKVCQ